MAMFFVFDIFMLGTCHGAAANAVIVFDLYTRIWKENIEKLLNLKKKKTKIHSKMRREGETICV